MKKWLIGAVLLLVGLWGVCWFASPYWVSYQIQQAVKHNDANKLSGYIDFVQLKQSFKARFEQEMQNRITASGNPQIAAMAQMFSNSFVDKMLDSMISPEGIQMLMQGKQAYENNSAITNNPALFKSDDSGLALQNEHANANRHANSDDTVSEYNTASKVEPKYSGSYDGLNRFVLTQNSADGQQVGFVLSRDGLSWKMTEIVMPNKPE